ncbi:hypothetical protein [Natronobacterium gregoryi]|uniref:GCN5 family acetyltransferase n=2 Tax=Natronobacterium gregoryi TaxID=44930 RepID=L0AG35_NATGS|nr:hypothetical protein [Natronobacterium gregoryi]AFZ72771.1 hypothetical protein Natgr_1566 [Natronobacterium gregoryi SP2]ELY69463.1 N-acetyltransferase GCN5 [Natronobacterium gregoryi SP2]PLK21115.1 GCN5 family acetyltransferase [Natronobacterium gregoryi SP2]SFJ11259.1 hypothetical protein SAMN05443661_11468 [Natronobacterium gregoryi]
MEIRPLESDDVETLVDDRWFPLAREMGDFDEFNRVADDVREDAIGYHERALTDTDYCNDLPAQPPPGSRLCRK